MTRHFALHITNRLFPFQQEAEAPKPGRQRIAVRSNISIVFISHAQKVGDARESNF
jgi:hypothetical protein